MFSALAGASAGPTTAALAQSSEPLSTTFRWTGFYIGGNAGYGWNSDASIDLRPTATATGLFASETPYVVASQAATLSPLGVEAKGGLGGVQAGYNRQTKWLVVGIEADYAWSNITGSNARSLHSEFDIPGEPGFGVTTSVAGQTRRRALPSAASPSIAATQTETGPTPCITFTPTSGAGSDNRTGWTAGVAGEWAFAPNWSAKAEYLHYDVGTLHYGTKEITDVSCPKMNPASTPFASINLAPAAEIKGDLVGFGLNFKLSGP